MRENTRCEVDEPISTPTESTHNSSSSPKVRPVEEKKMRPPWSSSSVILCHARPCAGHPRLGEKGKVVDGRDKPGHDDWLGVLRSFLRQQPAIIALVIF